MKNPLKNRGHWVGLFYLTLSDISAESLSQNKKSGAISGPAYDDERENFY